MEQLTNTTIVQNLFNEISSFRKFDLILVITIWLTSLIIIYFLEFKQAKEYIEKKATIICMVLISLLFFVLFSKSLLRFNAIQYSLENDCFEVVTDVIIKTKISTYDDDTTYYVYLKNNGKISVNKNTYYHCENSLGGFVYVIIVKNRFGIKYPTEHLYPTSIYQYLTD